MSRPTLLDAFCGAGGCSVGYSRAGFDVIGVDIKPQPRYPFRFIEGDALEYIAAHGREFDVIHASPPCQHYSRATAWVGDRSKHPDLIGATQDVLRATGRPYVIENVQEARYHLHSPVMLCGTALGLRVRRHRYFETSFAAPLFLPQCWHRPDDFSFDHGGKQTEAVYRDAMECDWMTVYEARQAIPPAYTTFIGNAMLQAVALARAS